ncbi:MAG TPA: hypothetical protein VGI45_09680 [Terracidiphilus sp.]
MEPLVLMTKLIEIENAVGIADAPTIRRLLNDAQEQLLKLHREQFEYMSQSRQFAQAC